MIYVLHIDITQIHNQHHVLKSAKIQSLKTSLSRCAPERYTFLIFFWAFQFFKVSFMRNAAYNSLFTVDVFFSRSLLSSATVQAHIVEADMLVQYITAAFGSVCDPKWARKHRDLFYPQTHCMSLRWASRGEGLCRQVQLHTHWTSVHNLPNSYDEVCAKDIIFSASFSFINPSSSCQSLQPFVSDKHEHFVQLWRH